MAVSGTLESERRRQALVELADAGDTVLIDDAAERFEVSAMTIRRDLAELEASGLIRRVRGGAVAAPKPKSFGERRTLHVAAKRTIARKALSLLPRSGTIALDASSTISLVASDLRPRDGLTVLTNSPETFSLLVGIGGVAPLLTGGAPEPATGSLVGPLALRSAQALHFDLAIVSADALDVTTGTSEVSLAEAEVKRAIAERARECAVCVDASKLGRRSVATAIASESIDILVTELDPSDARLDPFRGSTRIL